MAELPDWQPFESGSAARSGDGSDAGQVVAVVASGGALAGGWAQATALRLAGSWSSEGLRVVLVDAAVSSPTLHSAAGVENVEGLTDAALFGVSIGRVAQPVEGQAFFLITAGSPTADPSALVDNERWQQLVSGFMEAGVTLVLFLRGDGEHASSFLSSAGDVIVLADDGEETASALGDHAARVRSVLGPATGERQVVADGEAQGGMTQQLDFAAAAMEEAEPAVVGEASGAGPDLDLDEASDLRPAAASDSWKSGGRRNLLIVIVLLVVIVAVVAYVMGILGGPTNAGGV